MDETSPRRLDASSHPFQNKTATAGLIGGVIRPQASENRARSSCRVRKASRGINLEEGKTLVFVSVLVSPSVSLLFIYRCVNTEGKLVLKPTVFDSAAARVLGHGRAVSTG